MNEEQGKDLARQFYNQEAEQYINQYQEGYNKYPSNLVRINMISQRLKENGVKKVLDLGCGTCGPMIKLLKDGFDVYGIDFSEDMIEMGKKELINAGFDPNRVRVADLEKDMGSEIYDAVLALGVFPHVLDEIKALNDIKKVIVNNGLTFISFRNELFGSFTFNNHSNDFFLNRLIDINNLPEEFKDDVGELIDIACPRGIVKKENKIVYNDILAKMHNPLTIKNDLYDRCGFKIVNNLFYHYHAMPPKLRSKNPKLFDELSLKLENPYDWRGNFMASAFVVEARSNA